MSRESSFEEVQDARNYLYEVGSDFSVLVCVPVQPVISSGKRMQPPGTLLTGGNGAQPALRHLANFPMTVPVQTYKRHERSREAIELAYDSILQEKMKVRHKYGFQPPRRGRRTDLQGDPLVRFLL